MLKLWTTETTLANYYSGQAKACETPNFAKMDFFLDVS